MSRLIEADGLKKSIEEDEELKSNSLAYLLMNLMTCYIDDAPIIDAEPVRHGHWISVPHKSARICSVCEHDEPYKNAPDDADIFNYCPHCGAKMDEVSE